MTSSARTSVVHGIDGSQRVPPWPRASGAKARNPAVMSGVIAANVSRPLPVALWSMTSGGPAPSTAYAMVRPFASIVGIGRMLRGYPRGRDPHLRPAPRLVIRHRPATSLDDLEAAAELMARPWRAGRPHAFPTPAGLE